MKRGFLLIGMLILVLVFCCSCECKHEEVSDASCTSPSVCLKCDEVISAALGHTWEDATCTVPKTCSVCNETTGDALGHTWVDATCTEPKTCSVCNETTGDALGHTWVDATCTVPKTCSVCNETTGDALGHTWVDATCTEPKTCSICNETTGDALGHTWKDATCTVPKTCSVCDKTTGNALGHTWKNATCTEPMTCLECRKTEGQAKGHSYSEQIIQNANCQTDGKKSFTCSFCSDYYTDTFSMKSYNPTEIYDLIASSVGEIITYDKSNKELALGTGFLISTDGRIVTNYHVIEDAYSAKITINNKTYTIAQVLAYDKERDLAVLKINASNLTPLTLCKSTHKTGSEVYAFGSSRGLTATFSQGIITYDRRDVDGVICVQHNAAISSGNSGGPLVNKYGEVIGINSWTLRDSQNLNFAISVETLDKLTYCSPLTMQQLYEKESDVLAKLKNFVKSKGSYDSADNEYYLVLGTSYSNDYTSTYTREIVYNVADDEISLYFFIDGDYMVTITLDQIDGSYFWSYYDEYGYLMYGTLYATTYTSSTLLGYSYNNITYSSTRTSVRKLASTMVSVLCSYMDDDFASIGVSAEDLGFLYY